jgi:hypothetical protein
VLLPGLWKVVARGVHRAWARSDWEGAVERAARYARFRPGDPKAWVLWIHVLLRAGKVSQLTEVLHPALAATLTTSS